MRGYSRCLLTFECTNIGFTQALVARLQQGYVLSLGTDLIACRSSKCFVYAEVSTYDTKQLYWDMFEYAEGSGNSIAFIGLQIDAQRDDPLNLEWMQDSVLGYSRDDNDEVCISELVSEFIKVANLKNRFSPKEIERVVRMCSLSISDVDIGVCRNFLVDWSTVSVPSEAEIFARIVDFYHSRGATGNPLIRCMAHFIYLAWIDPHPIKETARSIVSAVSRLVLDK